MAARSEYKALCKNKAKEGNEAALVDKNNERTMKRELALQKRDSAVRKIQAVARMWLARRKWLGLSTEVMFGWRKAGHMIIDDLVEEVVVDGLIPDVLIEIFSHAGGRGDPFATNPAEDRASWGIYNMLVDEVVADMATVIVKKEIRGFVAHYLRAKEESKNQFDPVEQCSQIVLNDALVEFVNDIVKESVSSMVSEYLFLQNYEEFLHTHIRSNFDGGGIRFCVRLQHRNLCGRHVGRIF